ncbi:hypothetical protein TcWFU_009239 [Taenia crassiceps]|uniref:Uncharacterized protein n=1 Tax=Taenia crassiceps TaxID=6207 RepID=A0ABR4Q7H2_9CEST
MRIVSQTTVFTSLEVDSLAGHRLKHPHHFGEIVTSKDLVVELDPITVVYCTPSCRVVKPPDLYRGC